jgi:CheY-like chemotaxis protein
MKILIVDDHPANRKLLRIQLEAEGFSAVEATDGLEALQVLAGEAVDAVIADILMPRMDGYRLCHEVRKDPALRHLRFILYSSTYTAPDDVRLGDSVGADQFIVKPAPIAVILAALQIAAPVGEPRASALPSEAIILQQYSAVLVAKLEEKNIELQQALAESHRANHRIQELNADLEVRVRARTAELVAANGELTTALAEVNQLNKLLPICSFCRKVRDDKDYWENVEGYILQHTSTTFSHGVCPACFDAHYAPVLAQLGVQPAAATGGQPT